MRKERIGDEGLRVWSLLNSMQSDQKEACTLSLRRLPRHSFLGALKRRMRRERPGALLARRTRTIRMCSFDARSKGQPWPLPLREHIRSRNVLARVKGASRCAQGGPVKKSAHVWDKPRHP